MIKFSARVNEFTPGCFFTSEARNYYQIRSRILPGIYFTFRLYPYWLEQNEYLRLYCKPTRLSLYCVSDKYSHAWQAGRSKLMENFL